MQSLTLNEFYIVSAVYCSVIFTFICVSIVLGRSEKRRNDLATLCDSILDSKFIAILKRVLGIIFTPVGWLLFPVIFLLALPFLAIRLIKDVLSDIYTKDTPYNPDNDWEYIKMMEEVNKSSLHSSLPTNLRQIYCDLYKASLELTESNEDKFIYEVLKNNRLPELIEFKKDEHSLTNMKSEISGNIVTLAYFWKSPSFEDSIVYIHRALDFAEARGYISFPQDND